MICLMTCNLADDTAVYLAPEKQNGPRHLQEDLNQLHRWEQLWEMEFNPGKCVVMHITRARPQELVFMI